MNKWGTVKSRPRTATNPGPANDISSRSHITGRQLAHNFGVVAPKSQHVHRFEIHNDSDSEWTVRRVHAGCACTIAEISAKYLAPRASTAVTVSYTAGKYVGDDERFVVLDFEEAHAPSIVMAIRASVRPVMAVHPERLALLVTPETDVTVIRHHVVYNFGDRDWSSLNVSATARWLTATVFEAPLPSGASPSDAGSPRQVFRLEVSANPKGLPSGPHSAILEITPVDAAADQREPELRPSARVLVELQAAGEWKVAPPEMFFDSVAPGCSSASHVHLVSRGGGTTKPPRVSVGDALTGMVTVTVTPLSPRIWKVAAQLSPLTSVHGLVADHLCVSFDDAESTVLRIPVKALIRW